MARPFLGMEPMSTTAQPITAPSRRVSARAASTEVDRQLRRLDVMRRRWWWFSVLTVAALAGVVSLVVLLGLVTADAIWQLPAAVRMAGLGLWSVVTTGCVVLVVVRLIRRRRTRLATARRLEAAWPELGSDLVNVVQFGTPATGHNPPSGRVGRGSGRGGLRKTEFIPGFTLPARSSRSSRREGNVQRGAESKWHWATASGTPPPTSAAFQHAAALAATRGAECVPLEQTGSDWSRRRRFCERMNHGRDLADRLACSQLLSG